MPACCPGAQPSPRPPRRAPAFRALALICLLVLALTPASAAAEDELGQTVRLRIEADWRMFDDVWDALDEATTQGASQADRAAAAAVLDRASAHFSTSTAVYQTGRFPPTPSGSRGSAARLVGGQEDARTMVREASQRLAASTANAARALRTGDQPLLDRSLTELRGSVKTYEQATQKWNDTVEDLNRSPLDPPRWVLGPFQFTLWTGIPVLAVTLWLAVAGLSLNLVFGARLRLYIAGKTPNSLPFTPRLLELYGPHLLALVGLAYVVLVFSLLWTADVVLFVALWMTQIWVVPILFPVALAALVIVSFVATIRAIVVAERDESVGIEVTRAQQPALWAASDRAAASAGTRPVDRIVLSALRGGTGVSEPGGMLSILRRDAPRVLQIDTVQLVGLNVAQFEGVLAHEYAHFSNRDTAWSVLTGRAGYALGRTLREIVSATSILEWLSVLSPVRWSLTGYLYLYGFVTAGFSRACELRADEAEIRAVGSEWFRATMERLALNGAVVRALCIPRMAEALGDARRAPDVHSLLELMYRQGPQDVIARLRAEALAERGSVFAAHPATRERLAFAERLALPAPIHLDSTQLEPAHSLIADWSRLAPRLSATIVPYLGATLPIAADQPD